MTNNWNYQGKEILSIEDLPEHEALHGFVYKITNVTTGKFYIGKKAFRISRKTKISAREKAQTQTRKKIKHVVKESDWKKYYGSNEQLKEDLAETGADNFTREILTLCCNKKYLSYSEIVAQINLNVLVENSYNGNIMGSYYRRDMDNCKQNDDDVI